MKLNKAKVKISQERLRQIVNEEIKALQTEAVDHEGAKTVVVAASKLLKAAEAFKKDANVAMTNSTTPELDSVVAALERMINNPGSFVDRPVTKPRVVKLRKVDGDED